MFELVAGDYPGDRRGRGHDERIVAEVEPGRAERGEMR
jgi:hypothetical protein